MTGCGEIFLGRPGSMLSSSVRIVYDLQRQLTIGQSRLMLGACVTGMSFRAGTFVFHFFDEELLMHHAKHIVAAFIGLACATSVWAQKTQLSVYTA